MTRVENDDVVRSRYVPGISVEKNTPLWNGKKKDLFSILNVRNFALMINVIPGRNLEGKDAMLTEACKTELL
jgi:hypothetical protein